MAHQMYRPPMDHSVISMHYFRLIISLPTVLAHQFHRWSLAAFCAIFQAQNSTVLYLLMPVQFEIKHF